MSYNNSVKDFDGKLIGYRCLQCGQICTSGWGTVCNLCREHKRNQIEAKIVIKIVNK